MKENWFINLWLDLTYRFNQSFAIKSVQWACSYFLVKCDKFSKPLISTMLIPLDDHICIIFYLTGILVEECLLTFSKNLRANIIFKKNISCVKSCPDLSLVEVKVCFCDINFRTTFFYLLIQSGSDVTKGVHWFEKEHFQNVHCHNLQNICGVYSTAGDKKLHSDFYFFY